jgi:death-on-curing protein
VTDWVWIDQAIALAIHQRTLVLHGGAERIRDPGLLQSALARALNLAAYDDEADIADLAAAYTAGVVKNHPFVDGNKRTGFVLGVLFLELNGARFAASEEAAAQAVLDLAPGVLDPVGYAAFLRANLTED